jgi:ATP-dependent Lon protease
MQRKLKVKSSRRPSHPKTPKPPRESDSRAESASPSPKDAVEATAGVENEVRLPPTPKVLPVLPLSDVVVFPYMVAPLLVSSKTSIRLVDEVVAGDRMLMLALQKKSDVEEPTLADLYPFGCTARVLKMLKFPDDTVRLLVQGMNRAKILEAESETPFIRARIEAVPDKEDTGIQVEALARNASKHFQEIIALSPNLPEELRVAILNMEEPGKLSDLIAANLNIPILEKEQFLEASNVKERLTKLLVILQKELEVLQLGSEIQSKVNVALSKSQREYFLREQMRQIQKELGEEEGADSDLRELRERLEAAQLPEEPKKVALKELDRLSNIPAASAEHTVARSYLDWLIAMPWAKSTEDNLDIKRARKILDQDHYGLEKAKERILEHLAILSLKKEKRGPILCFVGPPGVGKTSLAMSIARALGRKPHLHRSPPRKNHSGTAPRGIKQPDLHPG